MNNFYTLIYLSIVDDIFCIISCAKSSYFPNLLVFTSFRIRSLTRIIILKFKIPKLVYIMLDGDAYKIIIIHTKNKKNVKSIHAYLTLPRCVPYYVMLLH